MESAYHAIIEENISYWWALEEDVIGSYTNLMNKTDNERVRSTLSKILEDSRNHVEALESKREFQKDPSRRATPRKDAARNQPRMIDSFNKSYTLFLPLLS